MWSRPSIENLIGAMLLVAVTACSVTPTEPAQPAGPAAAVTQPADTCTPDASGHAAQPGAAPGAQVARSGQASQDARDSQSGQSSQNAQCVGAPPPVPEEAKAEFDRALALAHAGNGDAAQAQLTSLTRQYPQFCTPLVDLGILRRKGGNLDAAANAFQQAVACDPNSALAWTELGVTQRLAGRFHDAEQSYGKAIAADPEFAPAYRDRGVLRDLYLDRPVAALVDFEQYRKLTGEDKPVAMWIAELEHRTGINEPPRAQHPSTNPGVNAQSATPAHAAPAQPPEAKN